LWVLQKLRRFLHHKDPKIKDYDWNRLRLRSWDEIVREIKKCVLVCSNCHAEIHNPEAMIDDALLDNSSLNYEMQSTGHCPVCGNEVYGTKYCSRKCAGLGSRKTIHPTKEVLEKMMSEKSFCEIGRIFDVSDNAVRKWARKYDIQKPA